MDVSPSSFAHSIVPDGEALGRCFLLTGSHEQMAMRPPNMRGTTRCRSMFDKNWRYAGFVIFIGAPAISSNSGAKWCYDIQSVNASMVKCIMRVKLFRPVHRETPVRSLHAQRSSDDTHSSGWITTMLNGVHGERSERN